MLRRTCEVAQDYTMTFCLIINIVTRLALYSVSIVIWQEKTTIYFWFFAGKKCIWRHLEALLKRTCGVAPDYTMIFCLNILWTLLPWLCPTWPGCTQVFWRFFFTFLTIFVIFSKILSKPLDSRKTKKLKTKLLSFL